MEFTFFVQNELKELQTRDVDQLFSCIRDNLIELGVSFNEAKDESLYNEIQRQVSDCLFKKFEQFLNK